MDTYISPLSSRYASQEMSHLFSPLAKYTLWRTLWVALAESQKELGLDISSEALAQMRASLSSFDFPRIKEYEKDLRHDVMAHLKAYCDLCPQAAPIIHLGATSAYVADNCDLIQMFQALEIIEKKLVQLLRTLSDFSSKYASMPTLSYTHFQPAQPTTVGKRAALWLQDFLFDLKDLIFRKDNLYFLGIKGATGTQASILTLFNNDKQKVIALDLLVTQKMGFKRALKISSQTYPRKQDAHVLDLLAHIAISSHKFATDMRLLSHLQEIEEPFEEKQVGSSAMPYKRNPVLAERICSLSRFLIALSENPRYTAATQWLERTLDDAANRRLTLPEAFLTADAILELVLHITANLTLYPRMMEKHLKEKLGFMTIENILMAGVKKGGCRQELHEKLRKHSFLATERGKQGEEVDPLPLLLSDPEFPLSREELQTILDDENYTGMASEQVKDYLSEEVFPMLKKYEKLESLPPRNIEV